jgi:serine/threonine-protein kinase ATR
MALVSRGPAAKHRPSGQLNGDFEPPQSTMAAQLINNLSSTNKPSRQNGQDDLRALWELSNMANSAEELSSLDLKLEYHHKLIYVFVRLVLEPLTTDDPFLDVQNVVSQASDAIDAFILAIKETPSVLAYVSAPGSFQGREHEPLWVWLFPRLLALLGRRRCDSLTEKIKDLFFVSFQAVARSPTLWYLASLFFCYLKECVTSTSTRYILFDFSSTVTYQSLAILSHLRNPSSISPSHRLDVLLQFNSIDLSMFSNGKEGSFDSIINSIYVIQDAAAGLWHVTNLLSMLVDISMESATYHHATPAFQDYLAWTLDSFIVAHDLQKTWQADPIFHESCRRSEFMTFCAVQALLSALRGSLPNTMLRKACVLLSFLCADLLQNPLNLSDRPIRLSLCNSLLNIATVCKQHDSTRRIIALNLAPIVHATLSDDNAVSILGKDFQVRLYYLSYGLPLLTQIQKAGITLCRACEASQLEVPDLNISESFESTQLDGEFRLLHLGPTDGYHGTGQAPPNKRRKLHSELSLLEEITAKVCSLLGSQNVSNLAGLSEIAE